MKNIVILGSTGSIGTSGLDVVRQHPSLFSVIALTAGNNEELLSQQIEEFSPSLAVISSADAALRLQKRHPATKVLSGVEGLCEAAAHTEGEVVLSAIVGAAGLLPSWFALKAGKDIALANKETLVMAGHLFTEGLQEGQRLLPVDSEHSALFQALNGEERKKVKKMILTASGGPFAGKKREFLETVSSEQALKHPNWSMGKKISIDSATMMNKGLEVIEAKWLFKLEAGQIDVVVHPESIIHSMVEFVDGSVIAQMGNPDMRIPIAYALSYPKRLVLNAPPLDLLQIGRLNFSEPDKESFPCLSLALEALNRKGSYAVVLNGANEVAVELFLKKKIGFCDIPRCIEFVLQGHNDFDAGSIEEISHIDKEARAKASTFCSQLASF